MSELRSRRLRVVAVLAGCLLVCLAAPRAVPALELKLEKPARGELLSLHFRLEEAASVKVDAIGLASLFDDDLQVTAWILDDDSRRAVWELASASPAPLPESRHLRQAFQEVALDAGDYSVFLFAPERYRVGEPFQSWKTVLRDLAALLRRDDPGEDIAPFLARCRVLVRFPDAAGAQLARPPRPAAALIAFRSLGDDTLCSQGFRLRREAAVGLYALGEADARHRGIGGDADLELGAMYDYAWIEAAATGETVWRLDVDGSDAAGGAAKNRRFDGEIRLPAGDYRLRYVTDSSHAWGSWTAAPPVDPASWGVVLAPGTGCAPADLELVADGDLRADPGLLASLTMMRDDEERRAAFALDAPARLWIEALGEGSDGRMYDRGWIVDVASGAQVWAMTPDDTRPAGGADKNVLFTGEIELPPGRYEARFECDGSHAFGAWNAAPPPDGHRWGLRILRTGEP